MINVNRLSEIITSYKEQFSALWVDEKYKWEAVKQFQTYWNPELSDFASMFEAATAKTYNLLASGHFYPKTMILNFCSYEPETVRSMFADLYQEEKDLFSRVEAFQTTAQRLQEKYSPEKWKRHFQNTNAISTYLWLRYPDRYYIYKYSVALLVAKDLQSSPMLRHNASISSMLDSFALYDEICSQLQQDSELVELLNHFLTDTCYPDPALKIMTTDLAYFISRIYSRNIQNYLSNPVGQFSEQNDPTLSVDDWTTLLKDEHIFTTDALKILKRIKNCGGTASCNQLSVKYGESEHFYYEASNLLAKRIFEKTGCFISKRNQKQSRWWTILYHKNVPGCKDDYHLLWKLREELNQALENIDLSNIPLYSETVLKTDSCSYWWLNVNPKIWSFSNLAVKGKHRLFSGGKHRISQSAFQAKDEDFVIGYEAYPVKQIVALAKIVKDSEEDFFSIEKTEGLSVPIDYLTLKSYPELQKIEFFSNSQNNLFQLTQEEFEFIMDIIREFNPVSLSDNIHLSYTKEQFLQEVYLSQDELNTLLSLLRNKKNIILQGAPGVGKTFLAKRLAYVMMQEQDDSRIEWIQFHQNYSYEDFVMGYRPREQGFQLTNGIFYQFCLQAANHPEQDYFFIIDEINRGNMSKIFGELLMLIEKQYRGTRVTLAYSGISFSIPENLYLIGMMNTADRSLAIMDYALRRRFSFFEIHPAFHSKGFQAYLDQFQNELFRTVIEKMEQLNDEISKDDSLGPGFCIGHSYFCNQKECTESWLKEVIYYDIFPTLREYWFDDTPRLQQWKTILGGIFHD